MSQTEETTDPKQEQATNDAASEPAADEVIIVEGMKPSSALPQNKPAKYGNRKKSSAQAAPAVTKISSISTFEEEEIEMDDLPVRATMPEHLIDTRNNPSEESEYEDTERPKRSNRSRGERRGKQDRDRAPRKRREQQEPESSAEAETTEAPATTEDENRPARFGMVNEKPSDQASVQEFRPSRDGRVSERRKTTETPKAKSKPVAAPKKKGILSKIISFFTGGETEETKTPQKRQNDNRGPRKRGKRGPQNRERNEDGSERPRRRRPRNRKPRPDGEPRAESGNNADGPKKRRRRPRRRNNNGPRREGAGAQSNSDAS